MVGMTATKPTLISLLDTPTRIQTLPISISYSLTHPFFSSIIVHTHHPLSMSFSSTTLNLSSSTQLIKLAGSGRAFPFNNFGTLGSTYVSWTNAFINPTNSHIRNWIRIKWSVSRIYINASLSLCSSDPPKQPQFFFNSTPTSKRKVLKHLFYALITSITLPHLSLIYIRIELPRTTTPTNSIYCHNQLTSSLQHRMSLPNVHVLPIDGSSSCQTFI